MNRAARNGILMGIWVGSGHDSMQDIALASAVLTEFDMREDRKRQKEQEALDAPEPWEPEGGWDDKKF